MRAPFLLITGLGLVGCPSDYEVLPKAPDVDPGEVTECGFTQVEGTDFYSYDCNPVFTTSGEEWAGAIGNTTFNVTEVLGHPFYQLWYVGAPNDSVMGQYGLGYAVSDNGTRWTANPANPLLEAPPQPAAWNHSGMQGMQIVWDPTAEIYLLLYGGYNVDTNPSQWELGVASSPDGTAWTQSASNPVFDLTQPQGDVLGWCWPLGLSLGSVGGYKGYVAGYDTFDGACGMYSLSSTDGETWHMDTEPVLQEGPANSWYDQGFISTSTAKLGDTWYLFFVGFGDWEQYQGYQSSKNMFLGWATSPTQGDWQIQRDRIPIHQTAVGEVGSVAAVRVGSRIHLWVTDNWGGTTGVGYFLFDPYAAGDTGE
ncbi:MAG: hypothetical protein ABIO70_27370 [Pseudomonadota bacterium]